MNISNKIEFETYTTSSHIKRILVGIHGWKGNRHSFRQIAISLNLPDTKWYFPEAPYIAEDNEEERSWSFEKSPGVWERDEPKKLMDDFFQNEIFNKYKPSNVFIVGFSQGALMCYEYVLQMQKKLGGVFPIAGFIVNPNDEHISRIHKLQLDVPILIGHGDKDDVVNISSSEKAFKHLTKAGANVELLTYSGGHKIGIGYLRRMKEIIIPTDVPD